MQAYKLHPQSTAIIKDIGEYSIFIQKKFPEWINIIAISRKGKKRWYTSKEVIKTSEGTVFYFNKRIDNIFKKGCIYPILALKEFTFYDPYGNPRSFKVDINKFLIYDELK